MESRVDYGKSSQHCADELEQPHTLASLGTLAVAATGSIAGKSTSPTWLTVVRESQYNAIVLQRSLLVLA